MTAPFPYAYATEKCPRCTCQGRRFEDGWFHLVGEIGGGGGYASLAFALHTEAHCEANIRDITPRTPEVTS